MVNVSHRGTSAVNVSHRGTSAVNVSHRGTSVVNVSHWGTSVVNVSHWGTSVVNVSQWGTSVVNVSHGGTSVVNVSHGGTSVVNVSHGGTSVVNVSHWGTSVVNVSHWGTPVVSFLVQLLLGIILLLILTIFHLLMIRPKKNSIFGIHDALGFWYFYQLKVGLSSLSSHKRCHNFIDTPSDKYVHNQDILFLCPFFATLSETLTINLMQFYKNIIWLI